MYYHICDHDEHHYNDFHHSEHCRPHVPPFKGEPKEGRLVALDNSEIYTIVNQVYGLEE